MNTIYKTLSALVTTAFISCSDLTSLYSPSKQETSSALPTQSSIVFGDYDCDVGKLHEALYETIASHNGYEGVQVRSPLTIETLFSRSMVMSRVGSGVGWGDVNAIVGHDRTKGMYARDLKEGAPIYFKEGYIPLGRAMACDLAEKLVEIARLAKVKVP